jgi:hypothetical protein
METSLFVDPTGRVKPLTWVGLSGILVLIDFFSGAAIQFPVLFVLPIALATWYGGRKWGFCLAVFLPAARLLFWNFWDTQWSFAIEVVNTLVRLAAFWSFAFAVDVARRKTEEVISLRGMLPICSFCKAIRDNRGEWHQLEQYMVHHSDASFTHGVCPECAKEHFPPFLEKG